jgi:hypothetical protein
MLVIVALGRLRQEDCEFQGSLGYIVSSCLISPAKRRKRGRRRRRGRRRIRQLVYLQPFSSVQ